jgi:hypothetical protein
LIFLINKLGSQNKEIGIRADVDTIADLLVENLSEGSSMLRGTLPGLLSSCELLMKIGDEFRIQTEESAVWTDEFLSQRSILSNESHRIEAERDDRIRRKFSEIVQKRALLQGISKVPRELYPVFDSNIPPDSDQCIYVLVRDGWSIDENSVRADARQTGNRSPVIFVYIPKRSADDLRHNLIDYKAAMATLEKRDIPNTPEGIEARAAIETTRQSAEGKIWELLDEIFSGARVFQGGGNEILGMGLQGMVLEAAENALQRLYPQFEVADHPGWSRVYEKAKEGAPDALKAIGDGGEPSQNPVCKAILGVIAGGKRGADIRKHFESPPYGWSGDAIDGGLQVLLVAGLIRAYDERGQGLDPRDIERKSLGRVTLKVESATVTTAQRFEVRRLLRKAGIVAKQGDELTCVAQFLEKMQGLANQAGGESPKPFRPDTSSLNEIRLLSGNEQLLALYHRREELLDNIETWTVLAEKISKRWQNWLQLQRLLFHATSLQDAEVILAQAKTIEEQRRLLEEPDLIPPLIASLTQLLRDELNKLDKTYTSQYEQWLQNLSKDSNWECLEPEQKYQIMNARSLSESTRPSVAVQTTEEVLATLDACNLATFADRAAAIPTRFNEVMCDAAKLCEPASQFIELPRRTLKTDNDVDIWLEEVKNQIKTALKVGPLFLR